MFLVRYCSLKVPGKFTLKGLVKTQVKPSKITLIMSDSPKIIFY